MRANDRRQQRCRVIREWFGKTVEDVAREASVSEKTVYRYETKTFKKVTFEIQKCCAWYNEHLLALMKEGLRINDLLESEEFNGTCGIVGGNE